MLFESIDASPKKAETLRLSGATKLPDAFPILATFRPLNLAKDTSAYVIEYLVFAERIDTPCDWFAPMTLPIFPMSFIFFGNDVENESETGFVQTSGHDAFIYLTKLFVVPELSSLNTTLIF